MKKATIMAIVLSLLVSFYVPLSFAQSAPVVSLITLSIETMPGTATIGWGKQNASTIYLYRDYYLDSKPIATLKPTDTSYVDKISGSHNYSLMVIGKDGREAGRSTITPVYIPSECEKGSKSSLKLWIGKKSMSVDCDSVEIDAEPIIIQSTTFVSIRPIIEAVGGYIGWDAATKTVTVNLPPNSVSLSIGKSAANVNGKSVQINTNPNVVPVIYNGRTMLPLRFIAENLGGEVGWDGAEKRIDMEFPIQTSTLIGKALLGVCSVGRGSLGQVLSINKVENIETQDAVGEFLKRAKILYGSGKTFKVVELLKYADTVGRTVDKTELSNWLSRYSSKIDLYSVDYKSNLSNLADFSSVAFVAKDTGEIIDPTLILAGFDFALQDSDANTVNYVSMFPMPKISGEGVVWGSASVAMQAKSEVKSISLINPPGCQTCDRTVGNFVVEFSNKSARETTTGESLGLCLLSALVDTSYSIGSTENALEIKLADGCGFFPGTSCPDLDSKLTEVSIELINRQPFTKDDKTADLIQPLGGAFVLNGQTNWKTQWKEDSKEKTIPESALVLSTEDNPRPRSMKLSINPKEKKVCNFAVYSLSSSVYVSPLSRISMSVPILNTPSGQQAGLFSIAADASLGISLPYERPAAWFGREGTSDVGLIGSSRVEGESKFDCPCGNSKGIETVDYKVESSEGHGKAYFEVTVNPDVAFVPKNAVVELELIRGEETVIKQAVLFDNPKTTLIDETADVGEYYTYCIKLYSNGQEIDKWCTDESLIPNPWIISAMWLENEKLEKKSSFIRGKRTEETIIVKNLSDESLDIAISCVYDCVMWDIVMNGGEKILVDSFNAGETKEIKISIEPSTSVPSGEKCELTVLIEAGIQELVAKNILVVEAPNCEYEAEWVDGGDAASGEVFPDSNLLICFNIKNRSSQKNGFVIDYRIDSVSDQSLSKWYVQFVGRRQSEMVYLEADEEIQIPVQVTPGSSIVDGDKVDVTVIIKGCGEEVELTLKVVCKEEECYFEFEWLDDSARLTTTVNPSERWSENFRIWNFGDGTADFSLSLENSGERVSTIMNNYDFTLKSGEYQDVKITYQIPDKARNGSAVVTIVVDCGVTTERYDRKLTIKQGKDCDIEYWWLASRTTKMNIDMPKGRRVTLPVYVKSKATSQQLLAIQLDRSEQSWESGFVEGKLKQTFYLKPDRETSDLWLWVEGAKDTEIGDTCEFKVTINVCNTTYVLICNITCVKDEELGVSIKSEAQDINMKKNGIIEVNFRTEFERKGVGLIKMKSYKTQLYDNDRDNANLGEISPLQKVLNIYKGMPSWNSKYLIPDAYISVMRSYGSKKIKAIITIEFDLEDEEGKKSVVTATSEYYFEIPE